MCRIRYINKTISAISSPNHAENESKNIRKLSVYTKMGDTSAATAIGVDLHVFFFIQCLYIAVQLLIVKWPIISPTS